MGVLRDKLAPIKLNGKSYRPGRHFSIGQNIGLSRQVKNTGCQVVEMHML